eukprot:6204672-Pleurochrysis_carterae.AAC.4
MGSIPMVKKFNTGTGYPTGLRNPYQDDVTDKPILTQPKSVTCGSYRVCYRLRSQSGCTSCVQKSSNVHDNVGQVKRPGVQIQVVPELPWNASVAKAKQDGMVLLESHAAKWLSEDVCHVVLALDILGLDGAVGDQFADLELAAVDVL